MSSEEKQAGTGQTGTGDTGTGAGSRYGDFQLEIYLAALGGAGDEHTQRANVAAFAQWGLMPRMLVGARHRDLSVDLLGLRLPAPVLLAPIGVLGLCCQDGHGDLATAAAAARSGVPMIASTLSVDPMEDVAARLGATPGFFQPGSPAGARATWPPGTSPSCAACWGKSTSSWPSTATPRSAT